MRCWRVRHRGAQPFFLHAGVSDGYDYLGREICSRLTLTDHDPT